MKKLFLYTILNIALELGLKHNGIKCNIFKYIIPNNNIQYFITNLDLLNLIRFINQPHEYTEQYG